MTWFNMNWLDRIGHPLRAASAKARRQTAPKAAEKNNAWWAIRCSHDGVWLAHVVSNGEAKPLVNVASFEPGNIDDSKLLKTLARKYRLHKMRCLTVLGFKEYQFIEVEKPSVPENERKQAIQWMLQGMIDYPLDQATIGIIDIPTNPRSLQTTQYYYAAIAENQVIAKVSNRLTEAGIRLQAIDIRAMAQRNIAQLLERQGRGLVMLSFSQNLALLTLTANGELFHVRRIELGAEPDETIFEKIALELQRSMDKFDSQFAYLVVDRIVVAPFNERDELCQFLRNYLSMQVETFDLNEIFEFADHIKLGGLGQQSSLLPVLGAAIRKEPA